MEKLISFYPWKQYIKMAEATFTIWHGHGHNNTKDSPHWFKCMGRDVCNQTHLCATHQHAHTETDAKRLVKILPRMKLFKCY